MKATALILALVQANAMLGQPQSADLQAMVDAERAFIEMAKTQNRRDAFLFFLSDSAVTQGPQGPVRGKARIKQQAVTNDWLRWEVAYSDIAASGDFGFNTGPWEFRVNKTDEKPVAFGEFNSIWKKQSDGSWKNVLDIGISHGAPTNTEMWSTSQIPSIVWKERPVKGKEDDVLRTEKAFTETLAADRKTAYHNVISAEVRMMVSGHLPFTGRESLDQYLAASPVVSNIRIIDAETARSADMGYTYGQADVSVSIDAKPEIKKATFVRVWKKEGGRNWKIVLEVLTF